jgi:hypothetical protein
MANEEKRLLRQAPSDPLETLVDLPLPIRGGVLPGDVRTLLRVADRRIERFRRTWPVPGFVPSDHTRAYAVLAALAAGDIASGKQFCEWGSGFGVVACLAALLDFDAFGIEIEGELVDAAQRLADDFALPVEFIHGSFIPPGSDACFDRRDEFGWLATEEASGSVAFGPADFDVIFAYPWPDEERLIATLFQHHARAGAVLVTNHGDEDWRLRRKTARTTE